ncbi:hypothetical protein LCGC14_0478230 [marine sediment metagenome]|uniref:Uncharacterized protein n=1 Tax=marine sediment metagenome TaxID=412755 RepID=A0A0F9VIY9_9ZZZZ
MVVVLTTLPLLPSLRSTLRLVGDSPRLVFIPPMGSLRLEVLDECLLGLADLEWH